MAFFFATLNYCYACIIQTVSSDNVTTAMSNARRVSFFVPDPQSFATSAVATVGIQDYTCGCWPHALMVSAHVVSNAVPPGSP